MAQEEDWAIIKNTPRPYDGKGIVAECIPEEYVVLPGETDIDYVEKGDGLAEEKKRAKEAAAAERKKSRAEAAATKQQASLTGMALGTAKGWRATERQ